MRRVLSVGIAGLLLAVVAAGGARSAVAEPNLLLSYSIEYWRHQGHGSRWAA